VRYSSSSPQRIRRTFVSPISIAPTKSPTGLAPPAAATAMAHLRLLLSHTRRHSQPQRRLPLFRFSSDANSSFALPPPPPIKPVSYAPKPKPPPEEAATSLPPDAAPGSKDPLLQQRLPQQPPQRQWTRQEMRFVKDAEPAISPVSYPSRVAPLPEDRPAVEEEAGAEDGLREEGQRIEMEASRVRSIFGMPVEVEQLPYPTLIPVEKRPQKVAIVLVDAIRLVKVCSAPDFLHTVYLIK
jgi:hypothetical protein